MMDDKEKFLDSKTILAVTLVAAIFMGWQTYLSHKYPQKSLPTASSGSASGPAGESQTDAKKSKEGVDTSANQQALANSSSATPGKDKNTSSVAGRATILPTQETPEVRQVWETSIFKTEISSLGMGFSNFKLKDQKDRNGQDIVLAEVSDGQFYLGVEGDSKPLHFKFKSEGNSLWVGEAQWKDVSVERKIEYVSEKRAFKNSVVVKNLSSDFPGLYVGFSERKQAAVEASFLFPSFEHQEVTLKTDSKIERVNLTAAKEPLSQNFQIVKMMGLGSQYFATGFLDQSALSPSVFFQSPVGEGVFTARAIYKPTGTQEVTLDFVSYLGPKSHDVLKGIDSSLAEIINFGMFSSIAEVLLAVLKMFHRLLQNWGVAIIALTILVRLVVLPFNIASYRSMKRMQKIQPLLQSVRERYKDDSQNLQKETMNLMREHKVNPVGGCLPMLLQLPVFFALYQVLGQSVELYKAPFAFWIHDLSVKDPYYVLPALMGIAMFIQQKITPNPSMDPTQAKIMMYLPLVFCLFMISLPSGLTLYILISTVFGVVQQQIFMTEKKDLSLIAKN